MEIPRIGAIAPAIATGGALPLSTAATAPAGGADFGRAFTDLLDKLSQTERTTGDLVTRAAAGDDVDIHDVMIATQAESLAFQVGLQVRNKLVEAYQEIFRMQV